MILQGQTCGSVSFRREGAYMICEGKAQWSGEMLRIWLYGKGEPGYLGVLLPDGQGGGRLRKKFSLADYALLPNPMEYCGPEDRSAAETQPEAPGPDIFWHPVGDGTLTCCRGGRGYLAFPADQVRLPRGGQFLLRQIEGRQYVVFPL